MNMHLFVVTAAAPDGAWRFLLDILWLLGVALLVGAVAERLRQSAIVGYLIAGTIVGPGVLRLVPQQENIFQIAELGVAMLLFTIGLEFSPKRLLSLGRVPLWAGPLQVLLTLIAGAAVASVGAGLQPAGAIVIGAMVALSSTACALRILTDRAEIDSPYGRISLGILLIQDVAVVPLMLVVTALATGGDTGTIVSHLLLATVSACLLIAVSYAFFSYGVPRLLKLKTWRRNRDLPILLAVVMAMGSAWAAHRLGLSPSLGAFVAGVLLGGSPFAVQIRADVEPLKTILVTLFFAAVGMFGDVVWLLENLGLVVAVVLAIVAGKGTLIGILIWLCGGRPQFALASAFCLAQVGEFSFVLATIARGDGAENSILSDTSFRAIVSATIISLLVTPYLIAAAPVAGAWLERHLRPIRKKKQAIAHAGGGQAAQPMDSPDEHSRERDRIFVIGFGPAGQRAAEDLIDSYQHQLIVVDINPDNIEVAQRYGLTAYIGDATQWEVLEHAGIHRAHVVIVTVPSPLTSRQLVHLVRHHAAGAMIFARARYHLHRWQLVHAGAHVVVDEEDRVGHQLAAEVIAQLNDSRNG